MSCGMCRIPRQGIDKEDILGVLPLLLERLRTVSDFEDKSGGMFCLMNEQTGELVIEPTLIGEITNDQTDLYTELCKEKANRLRENIKEHKLSWQSRNEDEEKWGGAISDGDHIWSFSGLTEAQDEALMIMGAHTCGRIMNYLPEALANLSDNRIILDGPLHFWVTRYEYEEDEDGEEPTATSAATS